MDKPKPVHSVISITPHNNTNRFITHLMKNVLIGCLVVLAGCNKVLVRFEVKVQGNAESVFITGDHQELGTWNPGQIEMKKSSDSLFIHQIAVKSGTNLEYKFTQGSWNSEAIYETDIVPANHMLTVGTDTTVVHTVRKWKDELVTSYESITGSVVIHEELFSPELNNGRTVLVWLPPSYEIITERRYPVLYMHDGQNIFNSQSSFIGAEWEVDETVSELVKTGQMEEIIVVGLYNTDDRSAEYSPMHNGKKYSEFLVNTVKPFIDKEYRTRPGRESTAVMGSSMGGIISFHLVWDYPHIFSRAGCLSPAFLVDNSEIVNRVSSARTAPDNILIYMDNGTVGLEQEFQPALEDMNSALEEKGFDGSNLVYKIFSGAVHNETAWAERVHLPLLFFFGK